MGAPRYAPSSDLLAMLTKGVSLNSPPAAIAPDPAGAVITVLYQIYVHTKTPTGSEARYTSGAAIHSTRIGLVGSVSRDSRSAPFKMSDFPALDG